MKGNLFKKARDATGLSLRAVVAAILAQGVPMSLSRLQRIEDADCYVRRFGVFDPLSLPTRELEALASLYGVAPAVLLGRAPFPERPALAAAAS